MAFKWTGVKLRAVALVAEDRQSRDEIAANLDIAPKTLDRWIRSTPFRERVESTIAHLEAQTLRYPIARKRERMRAINERWEKIHGIISARAEDPLYLSQPGGDTGLLTHTTKQVGTGRDAYILDEFPVDIALLKELREMEKQAAQEAGQWLTRTELTGPDGTPLAVTNNTFIASLTDNSTTNLTHLTLQQTIDARTQSFDWAEYERLYRDQLPASPTQQQLPTPTQQQLPTPTEQIPAPTPPSVNPPTDTITADTAQHINATLRRMQQLLSATPISQPTRPDPHERTPPLDPSAIPSPLAHAKPVIIDVTPIEPTPSIPSSPIAHDVTPIEPAPQEAT